MRRVLLQLLLFAALLVPRQAIFARLAEADAPDTDEVCETLDDVEVDASFISAVLNAAGSGHLYKIAPGSARAGFCVQGPLGMVRAEFQQLTGGLALGRSASAALVSLDVNSLRSNTPLAVSLLQSEDFLDAEKHPKITFVSHDIEWISREKAVIRGTLTMHGVSREIAFYLHVSPAESAPLSQAGRLRIKASTTISRSAFGMTAMPMVDDKVNLCMEAEAYRFELEPL